MRESNDLETQMMNLLDEARNGYFLENFFYFNEVVLSFVDVIAVSFYSKLMAFNPILVPLYKLKNLKYRKHLTIGEHPTCRQ